MAESSLATLRRLNRERYPCGIKGCGRTAYRGALCRAHWDMVPREDKHKLVVEVMTASYSAARKHHRRFLRDLRARLASG